MKKFAITLSVCLVVALTVVLAGCGGASKTYLDGTYVMTAFQENSEVNNINFNSSTMGQYTIEFATNGSIDLVFVTPVTTTSGGTTTINAQKSTLSGTYFFKNDAMTLKEGNMTHKTYVLTKNGNNNTITFKFVSSGKTLYTATYTLQII